MMNRLTDDQRRLIRNFLEGQGLTFDPLLEEMLDHVSSDIEERMKQGISFDEALRQARDEIPENHLVTIQTETMETINKRFTISRTLSFLALALMFGGTGFKILHLQGASALLLLSFAAIAGAFLSSTVSGIYIHKEKKGAARVLSIVAGTLLLMLGYSFRLLHLPGADFIVVLGVAISLASLLFNTLYVYRNTSGESNLLTYLHEKYTPGIERFFLLLLVPTGILRILTLPLPPNAFLGSFILIIVIYGAGLQLFALLWRRLEKYPGKRNVAILSALILSFTCFDLVFLGELLGYEIRLVLIMIFSMITAWLTINLDTPKNIFLLLVVWMVPVLLTASALIRLHVIPGSWAPIFFNIGVLLILTAGIFTSKKHEVTRAFLILSLASYLMEYITG
jgi:hypothetical protein